MNDRKRQEKAREVLKALLQELVLNSGLRLARHHPPEYIRDLGHLGVVSGDSLLVGMALGLEYPEYCQAMLDALGETRLLADLAFALMSHHPLAALPLDPPQGE